MLQLVSFQKFLDVPQSDRECATWHSAMIQLILE